jgi:hypothetical protein
MKSNALKSSLLALTLLLAAMAFAANTNKGSIQIADPTSVGGQQLQPGDYTVTWDGDGPSVQLNIIRGHKVVTTVPAQVVAMDHPPTHNSVVATDNGNGTKSLSEIRFSGKKYVLQVSGNIGGSQTGSDKSDKLR